MNEMLSGEGILALLTLTALEMVLGVDNLLFLSIQVSKLEGAEKRRAERVGLLLSGLMRVILVFGAGWLMTLGEPLTYVLDRPISIKGIVLGLGGMFLLYHAVHEIHDSTSHSVATKDERRAAQSLGGVIARITVLGMVFSIDSVVTAVGMTQNLWIITTSILITVVLMIFAAPHVTRFIEERPGFKVLGVCFLLLIGVLLGAEALEYHMPKSLIYVAMAFSAFAFWIEDRREKAAEKRQRITGNVCPMCREPLNPGRKLADMATEARIPVRMN